MTLYNAPEWKAFQILPLYYLRSIAERRILVRTLPVDVVPCRGGRIFAHKNCYNLSEVMITFLDMIDPGNLRMT